MTITGTTSIDLEAGETLTLTFPSILMGDEVRFNIDGAYDAAGGPGTGYYPVWWLQFTNYLDILLGAANLPYTDAAVTGFTPGHVREYLTGTRTPRYLFSQTFWGNRDQFVDAYNAGTPPGTGLAHITHYIPDGAWAGYTGTATWNFIFDVLRFAVGYHHNVTSDPNFAIDPMLVLTDTVRDDLASHTVELGTIVAWLRTHTRVVPTAPEADLGLDALRLILSEMIDDTLDVFIPDFDFRDTHVPTLIPTFPTGETSRPLGTPGGIVADGFGPYVPQVTSPTWNPPNWELGRFPNPASFTGNLSGGVPTVSSGFRAVSNDVSRINAPLNITNAIPAVTNDTGGATIAETTPAVTDGAVTVGQAFEGSRWILHSDWSALAVEAINDARVALGVQVIIGQSTVAEVSQIVRDAIEALHAARIAYAHSIQVLWRGAPPPPPPQPVWDTERLPMTLWVSQAPFLHGPIGNLEQHIFLQDRYALGNVAVPANRVATRAPEIILPMAQVPTAGGAIEITMTGWGTAPWGFLNQGVAATASLATWNADQQIVRVYNDRDPAFTNVNIHEGTILDVDFEGGVWRRLNATEFIYSGVRHTPAYPSVHGTNVVGHPGYYGEMAFHLRISGTTIVVTPLSARSPNYVLRLPLLSTPPVTDGVWSRTAPEVTMNRVGLGPALDIPFVQTGGGVRLEGGTVVHGRDIVTLPTLTLRENAPFALVDGGEIAFTLPFGFRFDHIQGSRTPLTGSSSPISTSGLGLGAQTYFPVHVYDVVTGQPVTTLPRDGVVAQSAMVLILPQTINRGQVTNVASLLTLAGVRVVSTAGRWEAPNTGPVYLTMHTGADAQGFLGSARYNRGGVGLHRAFHTATPTELHVATFSDFGVTFSRISGGGGIGNIPTIVAGWLPAEGNQAGREHLLHHERGRGRNQTTGAGSWGNVASVRVEEAVPNSLWGTHGFTFTLVDADGNIHPYASIRSVNLVSSIQGATSNATNHPSAVIGNFTNELGRAANNVITTGANAVRADGTRGYANVRFSDDGRSVAVDRLTVSHEFQNVARLRVDAHFALTADVNFYGPIYVVVTHGGQALPDGFDRMDLAPVHVADVRRGIYVETTPNEVIVGFQTFEVSDITVREAQPGDFRSGAGAIQVSLGEYMTGHISGYSNLVFIPISTLQIQNHIRVGGNANASMRVGATIQPFHGTAERLLVNIGAPTRGDVPSYITLHDLAVRAVRDVPFGTYELVVRGSSVLNNENFEDMNQRMVGTVQHASDPFLRPNEVGFRRYGHGPLMWIGYIDVITPGGITVGQDGREHPTVTVPFQQGNTFTSNTEMMQFAYGSSSINLGSATVVNTVNVPAGRLFVPMRSIIEDGLGGTVEFMQGNLFEGVPHTIIATLGARSATFYVGETHFRLPNGSLVPMMTDGVMTAPFIGDGVVGVSGRTYLPLRYIAVALGLEITTDASNAIVNPR
jgi:hypothetical protein